MRSSKFALYSIVATSFLVLGLSAPDALIAQETETPAAQEVLAAASETTSMEHKPSEAAKKNVKAKKKAAKKIVHESKIKPKASSKAAAPARSDAMSKE